MNNSQLHEVKSNFRINCSIMDMKLHASFFLYHLMKQLRSCKNQWGCWKANLKGLKDRVFSLQQIASIHVPLTETLLCCSLRIRSSTVCSKALAKHSEEHRKLQERRDQTVNGRLIPGSWPAYHQWWGQRHWKVNFSKYNLNDVQWIVVQVDNKTAFFFKSWPNKI